MQPVISTARQRNADACAIRPRAFCVMQGQDVFYKQAAAGTLPQFSFINPPSEACDHPCHDMAKGERLLKDVYVSVLCLCLTPLAAFTCRLGRKKESVASGEATTDTTDIEPCLRACRRAFATARSGRKRLCLLCMTTGAARMTTSYRLQRECRPTRRRVMSRKHLAPTWAARVSTFVD